MKRALLVGLVVLGCSVFGWAAGTPQVRGQSGLVGAKQTLDQTVMPVQVVAHVDRSHVKLGETLVLTLDVSYAPGLQLDLPDPATLRFPPFEVRDAVETSLPGTPLGGGNAASAGRKRARYTVRLASYENGRQTIPAFQLSYLSSTGLLQRAQSEPIAIEVERVAAVPVAGPAQGRPPVDIHDIKGIAAIPTPWWITLASLGGLGALAGLVGLAVTGLIRRNRAHAGPPATPHALALAALERLASDDLPGKGRLKQHYERLAAILRNYLARRYELPVLEHTTGEVVAMMERMGFAEALCREVGPVLIESDLVKFARLRVEPHRARAQVGVVRNIVESTRPVEQPARSPGGTPPARAAESTHPGKEVCHDIR